MNFLIYLQKVSKILSLETSFLCFCPVPNSTDTKRVSRGASFSYYRNVVTCCAFELVSNPHLCKDYKPGNSPISKLNEQISLGENSRLVLCFNDIWPSLV